MTFLKIFLPLVAIIYAPILSIIALISYALANSLDECNNKAKQGD